MVDANIEARDILKKFTAENPGYSLCYRSPGEKAKMPCIVYFNVTTMAGLGWDNKLASQKSAVQVSVFGVSPSENTGAVNKICELFWNAGWGIVSITDIPPEEGTRIYQTAARFRKNIYL